MPWTTADVDSHSKGLTDDQKAAWVSVANSALEKCEEEGGEDCDASAIKQANAAAKEETLDELTKTVSGRDHDRPDFLVLGKPDEVGTWQVPVMVRGTVNHRLMGAAHAALHKGHKGNKYEGPDKAKAIRKLTSLYKAEGLEPPSEEGAALACVELELEQAQAELELNRQGLYGVIDELAAAFHAIYPSAFESAPQESDTVTTTTAEFAESSLGQVVSIVDASEAEAGTAPLILDIIPIQPGWGNTRDNNYYPLETLVKFAPVWEGAKMYTTDHVDGEKSVRTEVSQVLKSPSGFTDDGIPLARVGIFNDEFAQQVRNRAELGILDDLHNSIQASGTAETGFELDGREGQRVIAFDGEGANIDWVTQAGAGGQAHRIVESKTEGTMPEETVTQEDEQVTPAEVTITEQPAESEPVNISEDAPDPDPEPTLAPERVLELVEATNLPQEAKERMITVGSILFNEAALQKQIEAEIQYVKALTGSGKPNMPPTQPTQKEQVTAEEVEARQSAINEKWLRTRPPKPEVTND